MDTAQYLKDLRELCRIDSGRGCVAGTAAMADWFAGKYAALGFRTERVLPDGRADAPILLVTAEEDGREEPIDVLFLAHMDTVFDTETVAGWPFTVDEEGIGHGPGCVDCKGGCLLVYYLLKALKEEGRLGFRFCVVMNSDEERGSVYSHRLIEELAQRTSYCLVFEPGRAHKEFVGVRKGCSHYLLKAHGIAAHVGADFEKGANAVSELARWIPELEKLTELERGTALAIVQFSGGQDNGQVPDYAELRFQLRYLEPEALDRLEALLERIRQTPFDPRCRIEAVDLGDAKPPMFLNDNSRKLLAALEEAGRAVACPTEWLTTGGSSDGNWVACYGVGTLDGCGPCGGNLHTRQEYLITESIEERFLVMKDLLRRLF